MIIKGKRSGKEHTISIKEWEKILSRGDGRFYTIVKSGEKSSKVPEDVAKSDYNQIIKDASKAFKNEQYQKAKDLYQKANDIKSTTLIKNKLSEIDKIFEEKED